jgi:hypothetical protein
VDDARQIDANAGMSASKNAAKCLKGQKSQRNGAKNGVMAEVFTQKSLHQTIRPCTATDDELFRPSLDRQEEMRLAEEKKRGIEAQEAARRALRAAQEACSRLNPGDTGTVRGPSRLSIDVGYVVRYVNASQGTITIEATSSGQLNMNRGEMRQISCSEVGSGGRIEIYYK